MRFDIKFRNKASREDIKIVLMGLEKDPTLLNWKKKKTIQSILFGILFLHLSDSLANQKVSLQHMRESLHNQESQIN